MYSSFLISVSLDGDSSDEHNNISISLEQEDEDESEKSSTKFVEWMQENSLSPTPLSVFTLYEEFMSSCDSDGTLTVYLRVYLSDLSVPYTLIASYGELSGGELIETTVTNREEMDIEDSSTIEFGTIVKAEFDGDVRDVNGAVISTPDFDFTDTEISFSSKVDGTLAVTKNISYYKHTLVISPRDLTEEELASDEFSLSDLYTSTAKLYADEQKKSVEIGMPSNFGTCEGGFGISVIAPGDENVEEFDVVFQAFDFCTGEDIDGATFIVDGTTISDPETGAVVNSGEHTIVVSASGYTSSDTDDLDENDSFTLSSTE